MMTRKGCSGIYKVLNENSNTPNGVKKWDYLNNTTMWKQAFCILKKLTTDTKLMWLQYRILHNILTTNRSVSKYNPNQTDRCSFCRSSSETITHLMWQCPRVNSFWRQLSSLIKTRCNINCADVINETLVIFGITNYNCKVLEMVVLLGKQYIYNCKVFDKNINLSNFIQVLFYRYKVDAIINARKEIDVNPIYEWEKLGNLFRGLGVGDPVQ